MRKSLAFLFIAMAALLAFQSFGDQWTMTISGSTRCIPARDPVGLGKTVTAWEDDLSVTAGTYYTNSAGAAYMAVTSGTSTNEPTSSFVDSTSDAVTWLKCGSFRWPRGITMKVNSGSEVHYNRNAAATTNCPWTVGRSFDVEVSSSDYFFVPASGSSIVSFITE